LGKLFGSLAPIDQVDVKAAAPNSPLMIRGHPFCLAKPAPLRDSPALVSVESGVTAANPHPDTSEDIKPQFQEVYNWLIQPAQTALAQSGVETLVFVLDGSLRNIPMAALYDGEQYLVEKHVAHPRFAAC